MSLLDFPTPAGLGVRGTVLVVPGRGESRTGYQRFGARLAADAYAVRVLEPPLLDHDDPVGSLERLTDDLTAAVAALPADRPLVLVGSDTGAVALGALAARGGPAAPWWPDGLVLAGIPGHGPRWSGDWTAELDARTHCPAQRSRLTEDAEVVRGTLADPVPVDLLDLALGGWSGLPQLLLVGDADPLADRAALTRAVGVLPKARLTVVRGGHHDVLNDLQHRSVAAEVVTFLEALRLDPAVAPVLEVAASAW